jgi:hypothetical protein
MMMMMMMMMVAVVEVMGMIILSLGVFGGGINNRGGRILESNETTINNYLKMKIYVYIYVVLSRYNLSTHYLHYYY